MKKQIKVTVKHLQKYQPVLNAFLVKRRLRSKFLENCETLNLEQIKQLTISGAFVWAHTSEGHVFWSKLFTQFSNN